MATGGAFSATIGWIAGCVYALIVAALLGQIGSAYPTAGALYHWSSILGNRGLGWTTAWINLIGLIFVLASVNVGVYLLFSGLVAGPILHIDTAAWGIREQTLAVVFITITQAAFNHFGIRITKFLVDFSGYLIVVTSLLLTFTFLYWGHIHGFSRLFAFSNNTGAPGGNYIPDPRSSLVAFLIGLLYPLYTMTGFDASAHTAEETKDARRAVPRGMMLSVVYSMLFGFIMIAAFVLASPDPAAMAKDGANAWFNLYQNLPAPVWLKSLLACAIVLSNYLCGLATITSTSRMIFAFARDGGLPGSSLWRKISHRFRSPVCAIWLTGTLGIAATLYSPAFAALAAGCALFLYISYILPIIAGFFAEGKSWTEFGPFRLGVWSKPLAVVAVLGLIVLVYAGIQPPSDIVLNYAGGLAVLLLVLWFGVERRRFKGPPMGAAAIEAREAAILQAEKEMGEEP